MEAAGPTDAKSMRPQVFGTTDQFHELPQASFFVERGHFYFVKNGDISISR
jgi:hypothetical protein